MSLYTEQVPELNDVATPRAPVVRVEVPEHPHILLVSGSLADRETLEPELARRGYRIRFAGTASTALDGFRDADLVLLDPDLPDLEGIDICGRIRMSSVVPMIVISDRADEVNCVLALRAGADDYIVKPYRLHELLARIESSLRRIRYRSQADSTLDIGSLSIDLRGRQTTVDGCSVKLTRKEFDLLHLLAANPGVVVPRETIKREIWGDTWSHRTIDTHVNSLRRKLRRRDWIVTVRGVGFMMTEV